MERLKHCLAEKSLKQAFFLLTSLFLCAGLALGAGAFWLCLRLRTQLDMSPAVEVTMAQTGVVMAMRRQAVPDVLAQLLEALQFALPMACLAVALLLADLAFYRIKLKAPLKALLQGAQRIGQRDLDFTIAPPAGSADELGCLCTAFETMRAEVQRSSAELWRQAEERRRLNAAFAHDLRNPAAVVKGCGTLLKCQIAADSPAQSTLELLLQYTTRMETQIQAMSAAQSLEDRPCSPRAVLWQELTEGMRQSLALLPVPEGVVLQVADGGGPQALWVDAACLQTVAENLTANALRYAKTRTTVTLGCQNSRLLLTVTDDGPGYPDALLRQGIAAFWRGEPCGQGIGAGAPSTEHLGMGLYSSRLLCRKHGGSLRLANLPGGAQAVAELNVKPPDHLGKN